MRILQVVPLISPTGEYGGPTTVALEQCAALRDAGHDVLLAAGSRGYDEPPTQMRGVTTHLFAAWAPPGLGLRGLSSPRLVDWVSRVAPTADVVHVHLARDLASLPAAAVALARGVPLAVQTHGMIQPTKNPAAPLLDATLTRRVLSGAGRVFFLTDEERDGLVKVAPNLRLQRLRNGITIEKGPFRTGAREEPDPGTVDVLYLARLQTRKRPIEFVEIAGALATRYPAARFTLVGPDEGEGDDVRTRIAQLGLGPRLRWLDPVGPEEARRIMARADLYVLPSVDEPYPMSVIEALACGVPVVVTDSNGLASVIEESGAGSVVRGAPRDRDALVQAVERYLADANLRISAAGRARKVADEQLAMSGVVDLLLKAYQELTTADPGP